MCPQLHLAAETIDSLMHNWVITLQGFGMKKWVCCCPDGWPKLSSADKETLRVCLHSSILENLNAASQFAENFSLRVLTCPVWKQAVGNIMQHCSNRMFKAEFLLKLAPCCIKRSQSLNRKKHMVVWLVILARRPELPTIVHAVQSLL